MKKLLDLGLKRVFLAIRDRCHRFSPARSLSNLNCVTTGVAGDRSGKTVPTWRHAQAIINSVLAAYSPATVDDDQGECSGFWAPGWVTGFEPAIPRSTIWCLNR